MNECGIIHGYRGDYDPCILPEGHEGPHEYLDSLGRNWLWETDWDCLCEHCMQCEGDYCTIYWRK